MNAGGQSVRCKYGHTVDRTSFQDWLSAANPQWKEIAEGYEQSGDKPRANPDGDVSSPLICALNLC